MSALPFLHEMEHTAKKITDKIGVQFNPWPVFIAGFSIFILSYVFMPRQVETALSLALFLAPVWLPFLLIGGAYTLWYIFKRAEFLASQEMILLEIKPPRTIVKTPLAMEAFLSALHLTGGESTWWQRFLGGTRPFFSLELASIEGRVHFLLWTRASLRRLVESQLYAQYPGAQVMEVPDYTRLFDPFDKSKGWIVWGCDYKHTAPDPLPIKTYIEYGLDKVQKEPEQVDPLANLVEFMGSIGKGEYLWLQFVIRAHKGEKYGKQNDDGTAFTWKNQAYDLVQQIRSETVGKVKYRDVFTGEMRETEGFPNPTKGQAEKMAAIERNVSKLGFDVGARCIYIADPKYFQGPTIAHVIALFKPFSTEGWNGINSTKWMKSFDDYPWEIGTEKVKEHTRHELVEAYRRRQFFYDPFWERGLPLEELMVLSTEELATLYHLPSRAVEAPTLDRIQSATSEAPPNLPV